MMLSASQSLLEWYSFCVIPALYTGSGDWKLGMETGELCFVCWEVRHGVILKNRFLCEGFYITSFFPLSCKTLSFKVPFNFGKERSSTDSSHGESIKPISNDHLDQNEHWNWFRSILICPDDGRGRKLSIINIEVMIIVCVTWRLYGNIFLWKLNSSC